jgi:hypothetical protein
MKKIILLLLLLPFISQAQIVLTSTTHTLEVTTTSTSGIDYRVTYFDETSSGASIDSTKLGKITTATTTPIVSAPASSTTRVIKYITLANIGAADNVVTVKVDVSATEYEETPDYTLRSGEAIYYSVSYGWQRSFDLISTISGLTKSFGKTQTATDAASYHYGGWKDAGTLGAWAPGTPGLGGRSTDGTTSTDAGCVFFPDAGSGKVRYLTQATICATQVGAYALYDVVWVNSGVNVTTTTGQTINSVIFPARDDSGGVNGQGYQIGIYATAALGNAGVVSNSTITYTNSGGTGSRTATLSATAPNNFPATPVIGTVVWFELAAGDIGVKSIETLTLNTTLTSGSLSIFVARKLIDLNASVINGTFNNTLNAGQGVVLYDNACILPFYQSSVTTAANIQGTVTTVTR